MSNRVLIAEKPSVAQTYADALALKNMQRKDGYIEGTSTWDGNNYRITWSVGHLVTLSMPDQYDEKYKKWNWEDLPFMPEKFKYEVIRTSAKQYKVVKTLYHDKSYLEHDGEIIYGGDSGREGLYIQALIRMLAGTVNGVSEKVLWIDSQTEEEIRKGLSCMKSFDSYKGLEDSGYVRAIADYVFGLNYSRMLSIKHGRNFNKTIGSTKYKPISVGRVMTCVMAMIVERERQIQNFKPTYFYKLFANCGNDDFAFSVDWIPKEDSTLYTTNQIYDNKGFLDLNNANQLVEDLNKEQKLTVTEVNDKTTKKAAPLLYNLAELQNECSKRFKISPDETLEIAQILYEMKLTTYPRTDARVLSTAIAKEIDKNLKGLLALDYNKEFVSQILNFGMYAGIEKTKYTNDKQIKDHYAIIPTGKSDISGLTDLQIKVYHMIVDRFICIFLPNAEFVTSTVILSAPNGENFKISEKSLVKSGYMEVLKGKMEEDEEIGSKLSDYLHKGDEFRSEFFVDEGTTSAPKRYTSGSIILAMENAGNLIEDEELRAQIKGSGIGTSATRAEILKKLCQNEYIKINKKTQIIKPMIAGEAVYDIVKDTIPSFLSPKMTASWEKGLTMIEEGTETRNQYLQKIRIDINKTFQLLSSIETEMEQESEKFESKTLELKCPYCNEPIVTMKNGFRCKNYKFDKSGCGFIASTICGTQITEEILNELLTKDKTRLLSFKSKKGNDFPAYLTINKEKKSIEFILKNKR